MKIGLLIPLQGAAGLWGPSCESCARLAMADLNAASGVLGESVELLVLDSGASRAEVARLLANATAPQHVTGRQPIDALVGMHPSDLRGFVSRSIPADLPYIYTPLYEGGEFAPNVFAIGETPDRLLRPGIAWMADHHRARRWFFIGNDYVWPRMMHRVARGLVVQHGGCDVGEAYLPFGIQDYEPVLAAIKGAQPDAVLMSLLGDEAIRFNRAFAAAGLPASVERFSTAVDENVLYGIGADCTENMVVSSGYFAHLATRENDVFRERYHGLLGEAPPMQNDLGESCYEGLHYFAALAEHARSTSARAMRRAERSLPFHRSARFAGQGTARHRKIHVAAADGLDLHVLRSQ